jgi:hypothetical protein
MRAEFGRFYWNEKNVLNALGDFCINAFLIELAILGVVMAMVNYKGIDDLH